MEEVEPATYQTLLFPDVNCDDDFIVLHCGERILDDEDLQRGYISRDQLLELFSDLVSPDLLGPDTHIAEFELVSTEESHVWTTLPVR